MNRIAIAAFVVMMLATIASAQSNNQIEPPRKANARATATPAPTGDPFEGATVEKMAGQCVTLETELGPIEIAIMPENAPEAARNFLNLSATGALETTTFSRVVKGFVIQGGNLQTSEKWSEALRAFEAALAVVSDWCGENVPSPLERNTPAGSPVSRSSAPSPSKSPTATVRAEVRTGSAAGRGCDPFTEVATYTADPVACPTRM